VAAKEAEEKLERKWQAQLQVSTGIHRDSSCTNICFAEGLGALVMMPELYWNPLLTKEKR